MVDLDSGAHYDLFKADHPQDREGLPSYQLSFKEGVRSSFRVALLDLSCRKGRERNNLDLIRFSIICRCRDIAHLYLSSRLFG